MAGLGKSRRLSALGLSAGALVFSAVAVAGCFSSGWDPCGLKLEAPAFGVALEQGTRRAATGERVAYSLFVPQPNAESAPAPYPAVVIVHGFARGKAFHAGTARMLAERGIVVMTWDLVSLLGGDAAQLRNIEILIDNVRWLRRRTAAEGDPLFGQVDPERIGLAGHSAGGAISFEAAIELAEAGEGVAALMLLDGVPWERTVARAGDLPVVAFASVRSEPSACNAEGAVREVLDGLAFSTEDMRVVGGSHCDPENPTDLLCQVVCGCGDSGAGTAYQELIGGFLGEALAAPGSGEAADFAGTVEALVVAGRVVVDAISE